VRGLAFVAYAEKELWEGAGSTDKVYQVPDGDLLTPHDYLHWRGLSDDTIHFWRLGYNPHKMQDTGAGWGITKPVILPRGITIPCLVTCDWSTHAKDLWYVKVRQVAGKPKYLNVTGGQDALFGADNLYIAGNGSSFGLLTEGEFDTILAGQIVPEVGFATLGSAVNSLDLAAWGAYLLPLRWLLAAYDLDKAGAKGAAKLVGELGKIHLVRVPALRAGDKDLTDYNQAGGDLWAWLRYNLETLGALDGLLGGGSEPIPADLEAAIMAGMVQA
jgi:DNA primase